MPRPSPRRLAPERGGSWPSGSGVLTMSDRSISGCEDRLVGAVLEGLQRRLALGGPVGAAVPDGQGRVVVFDAVRHLLSGRPARSRGPRHRATARSRRLDRPGLAPGARGRPARHDAGGVRRRWPRASRLPSPSAITSARASTAPGLGQRSSVAASRPSLSTGPPCSRPIITRSMSIWWVYSSMVVGSQPARRMAWIQRVDAVGAVFEQTEQQRLWLAVAQGLEREVADLSSARAPGEPDLLDEGVVVELVPVLERELEPAAGRQQRVLESGPRAPRPRPRTSARPGRRRS